MRLLKPVQHQFYLQNFLPVAISGGFSPISSFLYESQVTRKKDVDILCCEYQKIIVGSPTSNEPLNSRLRPGPHSLYLVATSAASYTVLYCTILYYTILYYTVLYYTILYYAILYYTILHYTILYYTTLHYTILYYTMLYYTLLSSVQASSLCFNLIGMPPGPGHAQASIPEPPIDTKLISELLLLLLEVLYESYEYIHIYLCVYSYVHVHVDVYHA